MSTLSIEGIDKLGRVHMEDDVKSKECTKCFNPFLPNGISPSYQLYQSISIVSVGGW